MDSLILVRSIVKCNKKTKAIPMEMKNLFVFVIIIINNCVSGLHENHGSIQMGVKIKTCDDGETNIEMDLPKPIDYYTCCKGERIPVNYCRQYKESCIPNEEIPDPIHHCVHTKINYTDIPPRGGPHRPIWPVYGEYTYIPVERWLHALEHGALVFLYDPCACTTEVRKVKKLVKNCIRKHIISPSEMLTKEYPMAFLTWGCKLEFSHLDVNKSVEFIKLKAMDPKRTNEFNLSRDGDYKYGLAFKAEIVNGSDIQDSNLCPNVGLGLDNDDEE